jgi:uncharacterized phage protein gp47/JayE
MPLPIRALADFINLALGKWQNTLSGIDPSQNASLAKSLAMSAAAVGYSLQDAIQDAVAQAFPQTSNDGFLQLHGSYDNTVQYPAVAAMGQAAVNGILNTFIPTGTSLTYLAVIFKTTQDATITNFNGAFGTSYNNGVVTATCTLPHSLATGISITISGCSQTAFNGTFTITVLNTTQFTFNVTPASYVVDSGTYTALMAVLNVTATTAGQNTNAAAGAALAIAVTNVNTTAYVLYGGISGGADAETNAAYLSRVMLAHSLTPGIATGPQLMWSAKKIAGNTRVFIVPAQTSVNSGGTGTPGTSGYIPAVGETCLYIVRDNDASIAPNTTLLTQTYNQIIADGLLPSFIPPSQLYVLAPILQSINLRFTSISPNNSSMQTAITNQLNVFFQEYGSVQWSLQNYQTNGVYTAVILYSVLTAFLNNIQDPVTGMYLTGYTLASINGAATPTNIVPATGQLPVLGTITWS